MLWLATDAAVDDGQMRAGIGIAIYNLERTIDLQFSRSIDYQDNHHAEFQAVLEGVHEISANLQAATDTVVLLTDSQIVKDSLEKRYAKHYAKETAQILQYTDQFPLFLIKLVGDRDNRAAHQLARQAVYRD
ncbi:reverse transcriptase-like protein [Lapidilactobacillus mulanensis]|uniref:Reverse transcriptase-like protein n=1 Tax=Lapidilactobacillus mulanensis TaxID=2485999 RepID=A0ABW4DR84_9LACO|nr:reverse transcriptase-like protein [Lapidilactobacillus mulanensis]